MSFEDEIANTIADHGKWKGQLRTAIDRGTANIDSVEVAKDKACQFGQ